MNDGAGYEVLGEAAGRVADAADGVVDLAVQAGAERVPGEHRHRRVALAGSQAFVAAREPEIDRRHHREIWLVGAAEQPNLHAELRVADAARVHRRPVARQQPVGRHARFDAVDQADAHEHGRRERANVFRMLPLASKLELHLSWGDNVRAGADVGPIGVDGFRSRS